MTFEKILPHLKQGEKVIRSGWGALNYTLFLKKKVLIKPKK